MPLTPEQRLIASIFYPKDVERRDEVEQANGRFVHYTTAETAMAILRSKSIWMRNARTMNDFSEIDYGMKCLAAASEGPAGQEFKNHLNGIHPEFCTELQDRFNSWLPHFMDNTFLTSLSEHRTSEDTLGRLSMWRAYGGSNGVALVIRNTPFMQATEHLKAYSSPVQYYTIDEFQSEFSHRLELIKSNDDAIRSLPREQLLWHCFTMFRFAILCTKHPGFFEEKEWRVIYAPSYELSPVIDRDFVSIKGIPQEIYKLPLKHDPDNGLFGADIPTLLDRIIIGPSKHPATLRRSFVSLLSDAQVVDPATKVCVSDIPLRT